MNSKLLILFLKMWIIESKTSESLVANQSALLLLWKKWSSDNYIASVPCTKLFYIHSSIVNDPLIPLVCKRSLTFYCIKKIGFSILEKLMESHRGFDKFGCLSKCLNFYFCLNCLLNISSLPYEWTARLLFYMSERFGVQQLPVYGIKHFFFC